MDDGSNKGWGMHTTAALALCVVLFLSEGKKVLVGNYFCWKIFFYVSRLV